MVVDSIEQYFDQDIYDKVLEEYSPESINEMVKEQIRSQFRFK